MSSFIGRRRELEEIARALDVARGGRGQLVLVEGEAGIGKTRLVEEALAAARASGFRVAWGRSWDGDGAPALWPVVSLVREVLAFRPPDAQERGQALVDDVLAASGAGAPDDRRLRLVDGILALLRSALAEGPLAIGLDDVHGADAASLQIVISLVQALKQSPVCWLCTSRPGDEPSRDERAAAARQKLRREGRVLALHPLDEKNARAFVIERVGHVDDAALAELMRLTLGNPLFLGEMVELLPSNAAASSITLPSGVKDAIRRRLAPLPDDARDALAAAAVMGRELTLPGVGMALDVSAEAALERLGPAFRAGFLVDEGGLQHRFAHPLFREVVYQDLPPARRRELHGRLGRGLAALSTKGAAVPVSEVAHHLAAAVPQVPATEAASWLLLAGRRDVRIAAFEEAARSLEHAMRLLESEPGADVMRFDVALALAEALLRSGKRDAGRARALEAAEQARKLGDARRLADAALVLGVELNPGMIDDTLVAILEEARRSPLDHEPTRAKVLARLAAARTPSPEPEGLTAMAREAVTLARACCDADTMLQTLVFAGAALFDYAPLDERVALSQELVDLALASGERVLAVRGLVRLVMEQVERGDMVAADRAIRLLVETTEHMPSPAYRWQAPLLSSMRASMRGEGAAARALFDEALRSAEQADDPIARRICLVHRIILLRDFGTRDEVNAYDALFASAGPASGADSFWLAASRGLLASALDDGDAARALLEGITHDQVAWIATNTGNQRFAVFVAEAAAIAGRDDLCRGLLPRLLSPMSKLTTFGGVAMNFHRPTAHALGLALVALGEPAEAERAFLEAVELGRAIGCRPAVAWALVELGAVRLALGRPEGTRDLERARNEARELGMPLLLARAERRLAAPAAPPPSRSLPPRLDPAALSFTLTLDGDVWTVARAGRAFLLKDSRGVRILKRLIDEAGRELHVLDLVDAAGADGGDAGPLVDEDARRAYKARLAELKDAIDDAAERGLDEKKKRLEEEALALTEELSRGTGLGGRERRGGSAVEKARINVQRRVKEVLKRIEEEDPELGRHLQWAVKTGTYCSYRKA